MKILYLQDKNYFRDLFLSSLALWIQKFILADAAEKIFRFPVVIVSSSNHVPVERIKLRRKSFLPDTCQIIIP